jgi:predicted phosphodiesterase
MSGMNDQRLKKLLSVLLDDLKSLPKPDTIFITGDIALSGKEHEYTLFRKDFLDPLLGAINLGLERVIVTPGNHDSNRAAWSASDLLMREQLTKNPSNETVEKILKEKISSQHCEWFSDFIKFRNEIDSIASKNTLLANSFFSVYDIDGVGIGCINSAWLSYSDDQLKLLVGEWQLREIIKTLKPFDQKILLLHHPLNWLQNGDKSLVTELIHTMGIKALFYGHMHEFSMMKESQFSDDSVMKLQAGKFDIAKDDNNVGYVLLALHDQNIFDSGELHFRKYDPKREIFIPWVERVTNGFLSYSLTDSIPFNSSDFADVCQKKIESIEYDLLCNVGLPADQQKRLTDIFVYPSMVVENDHVTSDTLNSNVSDKEGKAIKFSLHTLTAMSDSLIILGGENSGKSTLAKRLSINYLQEQASKNFEHIVYYLDAKSIPFTKSRKLKEGLLGFYKEDFDAKTFQSKIERALDDASPVVIIDSIETLDNQGLKALFEFVATHANVRFLLFGQLSARQTLSVFTTPLLGKSGFRYLTLNGLKRSHVRELFGKWVTPGEEKNNSIFNQALKVVSGAGMPNNPFVYTMLLSIRERKAAAFRSFMHEADLVENFIEIIMHKHVFLAGNAPQYKDVLLFLGFVAAKMHEGSLYTMSETTLIKTVAEFNDQISQDFSYRGFVDPIIISGIMKNDGGKYRFSQVCFFNYVYASWIGKHSLSYEELDRKLDFLRFDKVIEYVSAIKKSDLSLLEYVSRNAKVAWQNLVNEDELTDLEDMEREIVKCVKHDFLDLLKEKSFETAIVENHNTEEEVDEALDNASPLNDQPICEVKASQGKMLPSVVFHETLSLYARVFRAAEHIMDAEATKLHFRMVYGHYMNSIAYNVRIFDKKLRPILLQKILQVLDYESLDAKQKQQTNDQLNALINFAIAAIPNWTVAMMNSDLFNQRQKPRIEKFRNSIDNNLGKILLTYCLCELDDVDIVAEIKAQKYDKPHESSSLLIKIIELISFNFSISKEDKKMLDQFARKVLKDRKTHHLLSNLTLISHKIVEGKLLEPVMPAEN